MSTPAADTTADQTGPATPPPARHLGVRILSSLFLSELTEGIRAIALPLLVFGATRSLSATSLVAVSAAVPAVVVGIWGSPQVDRLDRQRIIVTSNVIRAVLLVALPFAWEQLGIGAVMAVAFVSAALGAIEQPSMYASLPILFADRYQDFVGKRTGLMFLTQTISPAIGGALVGLVGADNTLILCGGGYAVYALLIGTIRGFDPTYAARSKDARSRSRSTHLREGVQFAWRTPVLRALFGYWLVSIAAVPLGVLAALPYLTETLGVSTFQYGLASSCYGIASVAGSLIAGKMRFPGGARMWLVMSGLLYGTVNLVMGLQPGYLVFCLLWMVWGLAYGPEEVVGRLAFVKATPPEFQGRMFSLMTVVTSLATLIGSGLAGPVCDRFGPHIAMVIAGVLFIVATLGSFGFGRAGRLLKGMDVTDRRADEDAA